MSRDSYISSSDYNLPNMPARGPGLNDPNQNAASTTLPLPGAPISTNPSGFVDREISWKALPDGTDIGDGEGITNVKNFRLQIDDPSYEPGGVEESYSDLQTYFSNFIPNHSITNSTATTKQEISLNQFRKAETFAVYIYKVKPESTSTRRKTRIRCHWLRCKWFTRRWFNNNKCYRYIYKHDGAITFRIVGGYGGFNSLGAQTPVFDWEYKDANTKSTDNTISNGVPIGSTPFGGSVAVDPATGYAEVTIDCLVGIKDKTPPGTGTLTVKCRTTGQSVILQCSVPYDAPSSNPKGLAYQSLTSKKFTYIKNKTYTLGSNTASSVSAVRGQNQFWTYPVIPQTSGPPDGQLMSVAAASLFGDDPDTTAVETDFSLDQDQQYAVLLQATCIVAPNTQPITAQFQYSSNVCDTTTGAWSSGTVWNNLGSVITLPASTVTQNAVAIGRIPRNTTGTGACIPDLINVRCNLSNLSGNLELRTVAGNPDEIPPYDTIPPSYLFDPQLSGSTRYFNVDTSNWSTLAGGVPMRRLVFQINRILARGALQIEMGYYNNLTSTSVELQQFFRNQSIMAQVEPSNVLGTPTPLETLPFVTLATATTTEPTASFINATDEGGNAHNDIITNDTNPANYDHVYNITVNLTNAQVTPLLGRTVALVFRGRFTNPCMHSRTGFFPAPAEYSPISQEYGNPEVDRTSTYTAGTNTLRLLSIPTGMIVGDYVYGLDGAIPLNTTITNINTATNTITISNALTSNVLNADEPTPIISGPVDASQTFYRIVTL